MKVLAKIMIVVISFLMIIPVSCNSSARNSKKLESARIERIEVSINGMTCTGCEQTIQANIGRLDGIKSVKATFTSGKAIVDYSPEMTDTLEIREAITSAGYGVSRFVPLALTDTI